MATSSHPNRLTRFWHQPVRAERLGLMRIFVGVFLLLDQCIQYLPHFADFYGPHGVAPAGLHDAASMRSWYWTVLFFRTDNLDILYPVFGVWVFATLLFTLGWRTRIMSFIVWFMTLCFLNRNWQITIGADALLMAALFLLMLSPCGDALSLDERRRRRRGDFIGPVYVPPWSLRLIQIQLTMLYFTTGLIKLKGVNFSWEAIFAGKFAEAFQGAWWDGTAIHYVWNYLDMTRAPYARYPAPFWLTACLTYVSVWWEVLFLPMMFWRTTRWLALWFGILFHIGIFLTVEIGWFSFYSICFYTVWIPDDWWDRNRPCNEM